MKLERRQDKAPVVSKQIANSSQNKGIKVCLDTEVPNGKYKGKTGRWIAANDPSYMTWLLSNGILVSWGCIQQIESDIPKKKYSGYIDDRGYRWIDIYEKQESCAPSEYL